MPYRVPAKLPKEPPIDRVLLRTLHLPPHVVMSIREAIEQTNAALAGPAGIARGFLARARLWLRGL